MQRILENIDDAQLLSDSLEKENHINNSNS